MKKKVVSVNGKKIGETEKPGIVIHHCHIEQRVEIDSSIVKTIETQAEANRSLSMAIQSVIAKANSESLPPVINIGTD